MTLKNNSSELRVVVGLGATGFSCARYLQQQGYVVAVTDTRLQPPYLEKLKKEYSEIQISTGKLDEGLLDEATEIIISPGLSLKEPAIARQLQKGKSIIGDIELFARAVKVPVIAITGTNAKSTVTTLVGKMAQAAGIRTEVGGNLGVPALDLVAHESSPELFVLELSSFQLETTFSLSPAVATVLNITPDHMDRYEDLAEYTAAKHRVYHNCKVAVCNRDDLQTDYKQAHQQRKLYFTLEKPGKNTFGLLTKGRSVFLAFEDVPLLPVSELPLSGRHYQANALAALAISYGAGQAFEPMLKVLREFKGLPYRCQLIRKRNNVNWFNDSKGTNVGATLAAIEGLGGEIQGRLVLIAGGVGKNADFSLLLPALEKYVRAMVLIGEAAPILADVIGSRVAVHRATSLEDAVHRADQLAMSGDYVLLSPACASFDMFKNYEHRGEVFTALVQELKS
ncbi:MAG: UDP-N-acetylmuramoyl-L-alanine--D-glutamate ligase [Gammaproteobacteria bacterium RIFCSPHIGHO2_12_FULL_42_13]|nr:MAG: UDP-N-acetylmuramoyl-L-alanine--D-glutamate ligase [Gammaproteobacteria bacterium RIFCSPHIGHO2_12_FULL_42_13]